MLIQGKVENISISLLKTRQRDVTLENNFAYPIL